MKISEKLELVWKWLVRTCIIITGILLAFRKDRPVKDTTKPIQTDKKEAEKSKDLNERMNG